MNKTGITKLKIVLLLLLLCSVCFGATSTYFRHQNAGYLKDAVFDTAADGIIDLGSGGTGASLADPDANRVLGWDDTDGAVTFFVIGTGLSYDHPTYTLSVSIDASANWDDTAADVDANQANWLWTVQDGNLYYDGGSVGIGTVPTATLHVLNNLDEANVTIFNLEGKRTNPANNDTMYIYYRLNNSNNDSYEYARTTITAEDITDGDEEGSLLFEVSRNGELETALKMSATTIVLNEPGADRDFRIEAVGVDDAIFVQGSDGMVGINTDVLTTALTVNGVITATDGDSTQWSNTTTDFDANSADYDRTVADFDSNSADYDDAVADYDANIPTLLHYKDNVEANQVDWDSAYTHSQITSGNPHNVTLAEVGYGIGIEDSNIVVIDFPAIQDAHYVMDENADNSTVSDSSGNSNDATVDNGENDYTSELHVAGQISTGAFDFDGVDDWINAGSIGEYEPSDSFAVAFWLYVPSESPGGYIFSKFPSSYGTGKFSYYSGLDTVNGKVTFNCRQEGGNTKTATTGDGSISTETWYHIVYTYDGGDMEIFLDSVSFDTETFSYEVTTPVWDAFGIGTLRRYGGNESYARIVIDDFRLFSDALTQEQIDELYNNGQGNEGNPNVVAGRYAKFTSSGLRGIDYAGVRYDLGLNIDIDVQAYDATLQSISALGTAADKMLYTTDVDTWTEAVLTAFGRSILDDADEATFKATVNLEIGTDVLAQQTIGIVNDNLVEVDDADAADDDYAKFTANGLEGRSYAEVKTDLSLNLVENLKVKLDATAAPTADNDVDEGYVVGSRWFDVTNDKEYVCLDNTDGAAVWTETTGAGGGGVDTGGTPVANDYARFTDADTIEGRSYAEVREDLGLATSDSPVFVTTKLSGLTDGYVPYHVDDSNGLANSNIYYDGSNVGIDTMSPSGILDLQGRIFFTTDESVPNNYKILDYQSTGTNKSTLVRFKPSAGIPTYDNYGLTNIAVNFQLWSDTSATNRGFVTAEYDGAFAIGTVGDYDIKFVLNSNEAMRIDATNGNIGIETITPVAKLAVNGGVNIGADADPGDNNLYVVGDCSAFTFTDRTKSFKGDALAELNKIKTDSDEIDHSTLPDFAKSQIRLKKLTDPNDPNSVIEILEEGRDLGAMVSLLTVAVQQLTERIEELEREEK
jgi:hypothetical protein